MSAELTQNEFRAESALVTIVQPLPQKGDSLRALLAKALQVLAVSGVKTTDGGDGHTSSRGVNGARFASSDQTTEVSVTDAPVTGQKLVITDLLMSSDTALRLDFRIESDATVIETFYMAAGETKQFTPRAKWKLPTANKKLQVIASAAGNISITAFYHSEA